MGVGFPWISLDSLVRIDRYQWFTRDFQRIIFPCAFVVAKGPLKRRPAMRHAKRTDCSWGKLTSISDFLQEIAALPCKPPPSKSNRPCLAGARQRPAKLHGQRPRLVARGLAGVARMVRGCARSLPVQGVSVPRPGGARPGPRSCSWNRGGRSGAGGWIALR